LRAVGIAIYTLGLMMAVVARCQLGRNWSDIEKSRVKRDHMLVAHGIYRWVRHPIYAGDLLLLGLELALNSWAALGVLPLALYVRQKAAGEERDLARTLGYDDYWRRTGRFLPFLPG
jgi:protein-S-isoprenylcysteine O-methyltransferase